MPPFDFSNLANAQAASPQQPQQFDINSLLSNPIAALGIGLLTSKTPQEGIKQGFGLLSAGAQERRKQMLEQLQTLKLQKEIAGGDNPANVKEWEYYNKLTPDQQKAYLGMKRATQTLNLGGTQAILNPIGGIAAQYPVTPKPDQMPEFKGAQKRAETAGTNLGEEDASLMRQESSMPQLEDAVQILHDLGQKATYTTAGKVWNTAVRQAGFGATEGAQAREAYMAHVKNNVLPLLRQTFGAQFTKAEGDSLLTTMGDPDKSPEEKDAVLNAFIADKKATLETTRRRVQPTAADVFVGAGQQQDAQDGLAPLPAAQPKRLKYNPATGKLE